MEILKNFKDLRKRGLGNIAQYTVEQMFLVSHLLRFFTFILFFYTIRHVYRSVFPPEKVSLALVPRSYVLHTIIKLAYRKFFYLEIFKEKSVILQLTVDGVTLELGESAANLAAVENKIDHVHVTIPLQPKVVLLVLDQTARVRPVTKILVQV